jgi:nucleotide-binding universal stress UspA family protein
MAADPKAKDAFLREELRGDLPPLSGTSETALMDEIAHAPAALDLVATAARIKDRPLLVIGAERAGAPTAQAVANAARAAGGKNIALVVMPTDHSFSDRRIALATTVVDWLGQLPH